MAAVSGEEELTALEDQIVREGHGSPWQAVCESEQDVPVGPTPADITPAVEPRTGWRTVRVFVSSTFRDFHYERDVLVKKVFPDLRRWCQSRRLHLVDCDLRWGVPEHSPDEKTLLACLEEIDRCAKENIYPYFINMTCDRVGWVPKEGQVPEKISEKYRWVYQMSVTEMEIVHGAYRKANPHAFFLIRQIDDEFINSLPEKFRNHFRDFQKEQNAENKLKDLKENLNNRFPASRVFKYKCTFDRMNPDTGRVDLKFENNQEWEDKIKTFFMERIDHQYPENEFKIPEDPLEKQTLLHESFMKSRVDFVLGRDQIIQEIERYLGKCESVEPMVLVGDAGSGKTSIMAKIADQVSSRKVSKRPQVFYHFVGAVPGSTDLVTMLRRLLSCLRIEEAVSSDFTNLKASCYSALTNPKTAPIVIIMDAINQLDDSLDAESMSWLPHRLAASVKVIVSTIGNTPHHKNLMQRETKPGYVNVPTFTLTARKDIIKGFMHKFNKELTVDQMVAMLEKESSDNPLWLNVACEELRIWGDIRTIQGRITQLPNNLAELLKSVLVRFEKELGDSGFLLRATICLLECSRCGLCENELLDLLADEALKSPGSAKTQKKKASSQGRGSEAPLPRLPAMLWRDVYRNIGPFLRPYGDSGEGRLDFYHRVLSKVVRERYFLEDNTESDATKTQRLSSKLWWHSKLSDYFESERCADMDRKIEEYPYHLIKLNNGSKLERFLSDWEVFDKLYDEEHSVKLLQLWREAGDSDYGRMAKTYKDMLQKTTTLDRHLEKLVKVGHLLSQAGLYEEVLKRGKEAEKLADTMEPTDEMLMEIKALLAQAYDQKARQISRIGPEQIPFCNKSLDYITQCLDILRKLAKENKELQHKYGRELLNRAATRATLVDIIGCVKGEESKGHADVDEAIKIFKTLKDKARQAEAMMQKAGLMNTDLPNALKTYKESLKLCREVYGKYHVLSSRIHKNTGICAEDLSKKVQPEEAKQLREEAYYYYKEYYSISYRIFGEKHPKTRTMVGYLEEKEYAEIARERNENPFDLSSA